MKKDSFAFWHMWLFISTVLLALGGAIFAIWGSSPIFEPYNESLNKVFWHSSEMPSEVKPFRVFVNGPMGGTIACCYTLLAYIVWYPFRRKEKWARNAIIVAFSIWVVLDSAVCIYTGMYFQVYIINALSILQKALPIIFTWNAFKAER